MYWLFAGEDYYPEGGMSDFIGLFVTLQDAKDYIESNKDTKYLQWANVGFDGKKVALWSSERGWRYQ